MTAPVMPEAAVDWERGYRTIVADPPWPSMHQRATYHRGKPERHYPTMAVMDIEELDVGSLAAMDAHLWLWAVNRLLEDAYRVVRAWGFTPMSLLTWCKAGPGMGYYLRNNTEHCILATRGRPMVPAQKPTSSWFQWPRGRHSEKPEAFYELVEQVSPGPRLEMFARRRRPGWDAHGNEVPPFDFVELANRLALPGLPRDLASNVDGYLYATATPVSDDTEGAG